ncbi:MAG: hypothetical protein HY264_01035 [Chloroflexi bacterium]|nr:hypothetical protein [Chloroflexota bacterium]
MRTRRLFLLLAIVALVAMALAPAAAATPRRGALNIVKDCTGYFGGAGDFCTITSSNFRAIPAGTRIVYASAVVGALLDTDVSLAAGPGNVALGHCTLDFLALPGICTLSGGTGQFVHIQARVVVSPDATPNVWHWDGTYSFGSGD